MKYMHYPKEGEVMYLKPFLAAMMISCFIGCGTTGPDSGEPIPSRLVATIQIYDASELVAICALNSGEYVYASDLLGEVFVINTATNTVVDGVIVGNWCSVGICADISDEHVFVTCRPSSGGGAVAAINTTNNVVQYVVNLGSECSPEGLCLHPDGSSLYVASSTEDCVYVIDTESHQVVDTITVGGQPTGICFNPSGEYVYVTNWADDTVSVIRTSDNTVIAVCGVGNAPTAVCCTPDGAFAYIANGDGANNVSVLRTADNQVIKSITTEGPSEGIAPLLPYSDYVYVSSSNDYSVSILDVAALEVVTDVAVDWYPRALCSVPSRECVYVSTRLGDVSVIGI